MPVEFDPNDVTSLKEKLLRRVSSGMGTVEIRDLRRIGAGMDTYVYAFEIDGSLSPNWMEPLVLRVYPNVGQGAKAEREASIQGFVREGGFPAPRPLLVDASGGSVGLPFMVMERAPGVPLVDRMSNPLSLGGAISAMAALQVRLHSIPTEGCPLPYGGLLIDRLLAEPRDQILRFHLADLGGPLRWAEENAGIVRGEDPVLIHGDFHPLNILANGRDLTLLDWSDAALGDRHCDVARTTAILWLAADLENSAIGRFVLGTLRSWIIRRYKHEYARFVSLDSRRLNYWEAFHAFKAWVQIASMQQEGEAAIGAREGVLADLRPGITRALQRYFERRCSSAS